ncbi:MAG: feruloyl-CoA synthase [Bradyrhizobiaceae bacterium PARB1]|jgi:feruloyl-CoA synthase|nr:MAG: feruloyl-CoA synthase [Bradyrhizobiaceae bacterium PARB1]
MVALTQPHEGLIDDLFAEPSIIVSKARDGSIVLKSDTPLDVASRCVGEWLETWAHRAPARVFLAERPAADRPWRQLTYADARRRVRAVAGWLLEQGLGPDRPVAILSENSIDHGVLMLAAMHVGIPVASISTAYSLMSKDFEKLQSLIALLDPGAIFVSDARIYAAALRAIEGTHRAILIDGSFESSSSDHGVASLTSDNENDVERAFRAVGPDTVAKLLFTSGSTGAPKAVINTQRMMTSNQAAKAQVWPFLNGIDGFVILDWLPWSHTFGTNHNFNCVLRNGGTLYIDGGKPMPGAFELSLANLRDVIPTVYFNVPRGFEMLVAALREDTSLRHRFFSQTKLIFYAGAALPQNLWEALETLSLATIGRVVPMVSAWGSTETAPLALDCHFRAPRSGNVGVPVPGVEIKLVPSGDKLEVRVRGPNVTPGYWKSPEQTARAFDDEGFYLIGDAMAFADKDDPNKGLFFDGRVSEDFKLLTGTWVSVGRLRVEAIAALAPLAQDVVVTGHDRDAVGFMIFPNVAACRKVSGASDQEPLTEVLHSPRVRETIARGLAQLKARGGGSSTYATRAVLLTEPPSVDGGEITDKGYINQRAVLARRAEIVGRLYGDAYEQRVDCPS